MTLELVPVGTAEIGLAEPFMMPGGPYGTRAIVEITSASYAGDRLQATLKGAAAADWLVVSPQGIGLMDIRLTVETHDGARSTRPTTAGLISRRDWKARWCTPRRCSKPEMSATPGSTVFRWSLKASSPQVCSGMRSTSSADMAFTSRGPA